ncbi:MAG: hypothetical protein JKY94_01150 [Rhodobacteraceae bacterium]|nr:hypothetical protein [Paracoccaceae bacterium]
MPSFSEPAKEMDFLPIPDETLCWVMIKVRGVKTAPKTGTKYWDFEFTVTEGKHAKRKIFQNIMDPYHSPNSQGARDMGYAMVKRMLESGRGAGPENKAQYNLPDTDGYMSDLNGLVVAARLGIERGTPRDARNPNGEKYPDKNQIKEFLSPVAEAASARKGYAELTGESAQTHQPQQSTPNSETSGGNTQPANTQPMDKQPDWMSEPGAAG